MQFSGYDCSSKDDSFTESPCTDIIRRLILVCVYTGIDQQTICAVKITSNNFSFFFLSLLGRVSVEFKCHYLKESTIHTYLHVIRSPSLSLLLQLAHSKYCVPADKLTFLQHFLYTHQYIYIYIHRE